MKAPLCLVTILFALVTLVGCREPGSGAVPNASSGPGNSNPETKAENPLVASDKAIELENLRPSKLCNLEFVDGSPFGSGGAEATTGSRLRGWLGDDSGSIPASPKLVLQSADALTSVPILLNISRDDVVKAFPGKRGLEKSGFEVSLAGASIRPGRYHLYLTYLIGAEGYLCDNGRQVVVAELN